MRLTFFLGCFLFCLPALSFGGEAGRSSLKPLLRVDDAWQLSLRPSPQVLLAIAEAEAAGSGEGDAQAGAEELPEALTVQYIPWSLAAPRQTEPDWAGLTRDTAYIIGLHWTVIGILYMSPESVSGWSAEDKNSDYLAKWSEKTKYVVWDKDDFYLNYILHPYWGATYYIRGYERGLSPWGAFWFSALQSTLYEFGTEAFFEKPSQQDLIVTPVVGSLLGLYFAKVREGIKRRGGALDWGDKTILVVTDLLGAINHQLDRLFGIDTRIRIQTVAPSPVALAPGGAYPATADSRKRQRDPYLGVSLNLRW